MGNPSEQIHHGAHAIIRRGAEVLLVQQHATPTGLPYWSLPGGTGEPGELLNETLIREVEEETGIAVDEPGPLAWLLNIVCTPPLPQLIVAYFEVRSWSGGLVVNDPAGFVTEAEFVPVHAAIELLEQEPSPHVVAPAVEYLAGRVPAGATWCYRAAANGTPALAAQL